MQVPEQIAAAQVERMMKFQEAILKAAAGKLKWWEAGEILGITDRQLRRMRQSYEDHGYDGLYDYRKRRPSPKRAPMKAVEQVLHLYRELAGSEFAPRRMCATAFRK